MDQLGKIRRHHWKERLNISSNAKFESDTSQAIEHIASKSRRKLKIYDVCMGYKWGGGGGGRFVPATIKTSVKFRVFEGLYLR